MGPGHGLPQPRHPMPWSCSKLTFITTLFATFMAFIMIRPLVTNQLDQEGCSMSYMRPIFAHFPDFDTKHTRFGKKYSLYLYREGVIDEDIRVKGIPVLFVPGNAGSYKQVRSLAAQAAVHYHDLIQADLQAKQSGTLPLDFFSIDFNEDFAAFHGRTLLDQAEYLNDAVSYILALYSTSNRSTRDAGLPYPSSVILIGHSMGGIVARACFTLPNYQPQSVNTIITLAAPHAHAPTSFDAEIVQTYKLVNDYWRHAFSEPWASSGPLRHVTLISIAGGGLDTTVPSDYSTLASLIPPTHGFAVFTSTIPGVWTSMDHLAITWCDQLRKAITSTIYDVVDAGKPSQTKPRVTRINIFKKHFLTGLEDSSEPTVLGSENGTSIIVEGHSTIVIPSGKRLILGRPGDTIRPEITTYLMPIPLLDSSDAKSFKFLTNQELTPLESGSLDILLCKAHRSVADQQPSGSSPILELPEDGSGTLQLTCNSAATDVILLPASTSQSRQPFDHFFEKDWNALVHRSPPFSYLQYDLEFLTDYQFVAVVSQVNDFSQMWALAEFSSRHGTSIRTRNTLFDVVAGRLEFFITNKSIVSEISLPSVYSSLLAYKVRIKTLPGRDYDALFNPLLRQHISEPFESRFFVNVQEAGVKLHGVAPYVSSSPKIQPGVHGLSFQFWSDPTCKESIAVSLTIDLLGSVEIFWMRYRAIVITFPLMIVALVFEKQLRIYDKTGYYISFSESVGCCLRSSIPIFLLFLTLFSLALSSFPFSNLSLPRIFQSQAMSKEPDGSPYTNDLLLGLIDPFFWFLVPFFGIISVGVSVVINFAILSMTEGSALGYGCLTRLHVIKLNRSNATLTTASIRRKLSFSMILLVLVATVMPHQFVFVVVCVVQMVTCTRALILAREISHSHSRTNFYNYAHSVLMLLLCVLPINIPTLVVWIHNLAVDWLTPIPSHHNTLSILPFLILVETVSTGNIVPRLRSPLHHVTRVFFVLLAVYTALYGATHAYLLHSVANYACAWLSVIHLSALKFSHRSVKTAIDDPGTKESQDNKSKKL